jgi:hypothetical protein
MLRRKGCDRGGSEPREERRTVSERERVGALPASRPWPPRRRLGRGALRIPVHSPGGRRGRGGIVMPAHTTRRSTWQRSASPLDRWRRASAHARRQPSSGPERIDSSSLRPTTSWRRTCSTRSMSVRSRRSGRCASARPRSGRPRPWSTTRSPGRCSRSASPGRRSPTDSASRYATSKTAR